MSNTATDEFTITRQWVHAFATPNHGWTRRQLAALDIAWPPRAGWIATVEGRRISHEDRRAFESGRGAATTRDLFDPA